MAISAGQEGPIWAEDNGIDRPPCKTCTSCPDATAQSRIITSTTQAKNTLSGLTGLGVAKGHFLAKEAVSFSSYGPMGRNGTRYTFFLSIRGGLDLCIAPFCRSTKCFGPAWKFHQPLELPS
jgi:hypothetical protein